MDTILALDFGGTKLTAGLANTAVYHAETPSWQARERRFTPPGGDRQDDLDGMMTLIRDLVADTQPVAAGVSFGGPVDYEAGIVRLSHHVAGWEQVPLRRLLQEQLGVPVIMDNDANVAALGEWRLGAGRGSHSLLYVTISTGVGGGWVLAGRPYRGYAGMAGEIGHTVVDPRGPHCLCGKQGCVERLASGPYMAQDLAAVLGVPGLTGADVAQRAAAGQPEAITILERGAAALGTGIGNAANLLNPEIVVLGGGVTKAGDRWWQIVRETAWQTALPEVQFGIEAAQFTDDAPLWGAVALCESTVLGESVPPGSAGPG